MSKKEFQIERVKRKLPIWLSKINKGKNAQVVLKYFELYFKNKDNLVKLNELKAACNNIKNFMQHYNDLKNYGAKNDGKVFEEENECVYLWEPIKTFALNEYNKTQH